MAVEITDKVFDDIVPMLKEGVSENKTKAVNWYRRAAEQGDPRGQVNLGIMCATGSGIPVNYVQAYAWFDVALNK